MQRWDWSHPHWCSGLIFSYLSLRQHLSKTVHSTHKPKHLSSYRSLGVSSLFLFKQVPHITFGATKDQDEGRHSSTHPADQPGHSVYAAASCMGMVGQGGQSLSGKYKSLHIHKWTNSVQMDKLFLALGGWVYGVRNSKGSVRFKATLRLCWRCCSSWASTSKILNY